MVRILSFLIVLSLIFGCNSKNTNPKIANKQIVTVTIEPQKYFVDRISDNKIEVNVMVPQGSDPHVYEPTAKQMKDLSNSGIYFRVGHIEFEEAWIEKFASINPTMKIVDLSSNIDLIKPEELEHDHDHEHSHGVDPHIWVSPTEVKKMCSSIYESLVETFPEHKSEFEINYLNLSSDIDNIDNAIRVKLEPYKGKKIMIFHPTLAYFARDYQMEQLAIEIDGKEPTAQNIQKVIEIAKQENIRIIFVQKQFSKNNAEVIAKEINGQVVQIDPLDYDWLNTMSVISNEIVNGYSDSIAK